MLTGENGTLKKAGESEVTTDVQQTLEQIKLELMAIQVDTKGTYTEEDVYTIAKTVTGNEATEDKETGLVIVETAKGNEVDLSDLIKGAVNINTEKSEGELILTTESYEGYYADVDGDGEVDGIIYIDLMAEQKVTSWPTSGSVVGTYSWDKITSAKEYVISDEIYTEGPFEDNYIITAKNGTGGEERFYVMALEDVDSNTHCWYYSAYYYSGYISAYDSLTSEDIGEGITNTTNMIKVWNEKKYGDPDGNTAYSDVWGVIQNLEDEKRK